MPKIISALLIPLSSKNLRFLNNENKDIVRNKEIYRILAKNFSSFKA